VERLDAAEDYLNERWLRTEKSGGSMPRHG
jgi:hypothetical protein